MKPNFPSYWIGANCKTCNSHIGKLVQWLKAEMKFVVRMAQATCKCANINEHRKVTTADEDEYLNRYDLGESSQ